MPSRKQKSSEQIGHDFSNIHNSKTLAKIGENFKIILHVSSINCDKLG